VISLTLLATRGRSALFAALAALLLLAPGASAHAQAANDEVQQRERCVQVFAWLSLEQVRFGQAASWIRRSSYPFLQRIAEMAQMCPSFAISITGHTDSVGDPAFNQQLSLQRAEAVAKFLAELGVARDRLIVTGKGDAEPVEDNDTAFGRQRNRRIELRLVPAGES
tara:strand:- start:6255 stop:6755 length:501 start_codon:yes stop_codon:yes gene_type:complete